MPEVQLLSNGAYHVRIAASGQGASYWQGLAVTRWCEDATGDPGGTRVHVREDAAPARAAGGSQRALLENETRGHDFRDGRAVVWWRTDAFEVHSTFVVSADDTVELRRMVFRNRCARRVPLCATSYAEVVLSPAATDAAHPAFSKLFVETEIDPAQQAILATRRPSTPTDPTPWLFHTARIDGSGAGIPTFETDRMRFIGRGRDTDDPKALDDGVALTGTAGPVLDAVAAIRIPLVLEAGASITIDWFTGVSGTRAACVALLRKVRHAEAAQQILQSAGAYWRTVLRTLGASEADARNGQRMAGSILVATAALRADAAVIAKNLRGQSNLWGFGISGDVPIVLLQRTGPASSAISHQMVLLHAYWHAFGLRSELAIVCSFSNAGALNGCDQVRQQVQAQPAALRLGQPGGIFVLDGTKLDDGDRVLLQSAARIVVKDTDTLAAQLAQHTLEAELGTGEAPVRKQIPAPAPQPPCSDLFAFNGYGSFTAEGREYVITTSVGVMTPAPWVNVIANAEFGTLVSESGSATTWSENSHEFRLTPWSNDPVRDPNTEALYIRDDDSGYFWSPTLAPTRSGGAYTTRHGFGYSVFSHTEDAIDSELTIHVAIDSPVKFSVLRLCNRSERARRLSVTGYVEWVLGDERAKTQMHVVTARDTATGAAFARNSYNTAFAGRTAFFDAQCEDQAGMIEVCGDRAAFLGAAGNLARPAAMAQAHLSGSVGAALDPCAALRVGFDLEPGQTQRVVFTLGAGQSPTAAQDLVRQWRRPGAADASLEAVHAFWRHTLGTVQVHTPDPTLNVLANGWLLYQVIASRLWGRTAFYQSSGAFGFRDQLQDVMALVHAAPELVRAHLLRAAARQFVEGDVQHWWHPPSGKGVRTRCSDDFLWLALAICRYVETTGDVDVLDVPCPFLVSRLLKDGEASNYATPEISDTTASLYEHGARAIRHGLVYGAHGLPLMGSGDWNDGMNLVGADGRGESVWMAFFLVEVLQRFAPLARARADDAFADLCDHEAQTLRTRIEASAWDGHWYQRAWFDDGAVLGSAHNDECQIDSIAQSWSVLSGAAPADRAHRAMQSVYDRLVDRDARLVQLLAPPFDTSAPSPGYIQGYVPGVRENGGQYTHAAVWAGMAFAALGDTERAWELFALLNPLHHSSDAAQVATYMVEPYVLAGDVYANAMHAGRGGWSWYTGSAGWMTQFIVESLLGLQRHGNRLCLRPLLPPHWQAFDMQYRFGSARYDITCQRASTAAHARIVYDGVEACGNTITLVDDGKTHQVVLNFLDGH